MHHLLLLLLLAAQPIQVTHIVWKDAPPSLPKGTKAAILEGNPQAAGMFTMRLRVPKHTTLPPHTHPRPERVTVLSGRVEVGFGTVVDRKKTTTFKAGGFYVNPPGEPHFVHFAEESVIQLTGEGPWELHYVK